MTSLEAGPQNLPSRARSSFAPTPPRPRCERESARDPKRPAVSYAAIAPLDWHQFKTLLWKALPQMQPAAPIRWDRVAFAVNRNCAASSPQPDWLFQRIFDVICRAKPELQNVIGNRYVGHKIWNQIVYENARHMFGELAFMNLGYASDDDTVTAMEVRGEREPYHFSIQLYRRSVNDVGLRGRDVLEIGCGTGGGSEYLMRNFSPRCVVGVDILEGNIRTFHSRPGQDRMVYVVGHAEETPFAGESFDVIVNIESSAHYWDIERFIRESHRVLRPGGHLLLADLRWQSDEWGADRTVIGLHRQFARSGFEILEAENITANVLRSIELQDEIKTEAIRLGTAEPNSIRHFREIMLCLGSINHQKMSKSEIQYWRYVCRKPTRPQ